MSMIDSQPIHPEKSHGSGWRSSEEYTGKRKQGGPQSLAAGSEAGGPDPAPCLSQGPKTAQLEPQCSPQEEPDRTQSLCTNKGSERLRNTPKITQPMADAEIHAVSTGLMGLPAGRGGPLRHQVHITYRFAPLELHCIRAVAPQ